jgi:hypothetical protein
MSHMLEDFWTEVLSAEPNRVRSAMRDLSARERRSVIRHLRRMTDDTGWSDGQRLRALAALESLGESSAHDE